MFHGGREMDLVFGTTTYGVDWVQLTADLEGDDFSNGRTPDELRRSFENSAVVVFARDG